jgi:hypothetical protein
MITYNQYSDLVEAEEHNLSGYGCAASRRASPAGGGLASKAENLKSGGGKYLTIYDKSITLYL